MNAVPSGKAHSAKPVSPKRPCQPKSDIIGPLPGILPYTFEMVHPLLRHEADSTKMQRPAEPSRAQDEKDPLGMTISVQLSDESEILTTGPGKRTWRLPRGQNKNPDPNYAKDEMVWVRPKEQYGNYKAHIASDAQWDDESRQWRYQLRLCTANGDPEDELYNNGSWVGEDLLGRKKKT